MRAPARDHPAVRRAVVLALTLVALLVTAATAAAHPTLVSTDPVADTRLDASPEVVTLTFSEPVELARDNLSLIHI